MLLLAFFTDAGVPKTGLSPTIDVWDAADASHDVNAQAMTEVDGGWYKYDFAAYDESKDYCIRADGSATLSANDRYVYSTNAVPSEVDDLITRTKGLDDIHDDLVIVDGVVDTILVDTADMQPKLGIPVTSISADIADLITRVKGLDDIHDDLVTVDGIADAIKIVTDNLPDAGALTTLTGYVDEIESLLKNVTYGLSALKNEIDANEAKIDTIDTVVDAIKIVTDNLPDGGALTTINNYVNEVESLLKNATYGLAALETLVDESESLLKNATYGLSALKIEIDANEVKIDTVDTVVDAIKAITDNLPDAGALTTIIDHLTDIKGAGWTIETLKLIKELVDELESGEKPPAKAHFKT